MNGPMRSFVVPAIAMTLLVPVAVAQKPPAPAPPPPPSATPSRPASNSPLGSDPSQPREDLVLFLRGRVATNDGTVVPHNVLVELICNNRGRHQIYVSPHANSTIKFGSQPISF